MASFLHSNCVVSVDLSDSGSDLDVEGSIQRPLDPCQTILILVNSQRFRIINNHKGLLLWHWLYYLYVGVYCFPNIGHNWRNLRFFETIIAWDECTSEGNHFEKTFVLYFSIWDNEFVYFCDLLHI